MVYTEVAQALALVWLFAQIGMAGPFGQAGAMGSGSDQLVPAAQREQTAAFAPGPGVFVNGRYADSVDLHFSLWTSFAPEVSPGGTNDQAATSEESDWAQTNSRSLQDSSYPPQSPQPPFREHLSAGTEPAGGSSAVVPAVFEKPEAPAEQPAEERRNNQKGAPHRAHWLARAEESADAPDKSASQLWRENSKAEEARDSSGETALGENTGGGPAAESEANRQQDGHSVGGLTLGEKSDPPLKPKESRDVGNLSEAAKIPLPPAPSRSAERVKSGGNSSGSSASKGHSLSLSTSIILLTVGAIVASLGAIGWLGSAKASRPGGLLPTEAVEVLGRRPLTPRISLQLIRCGNRVLLVAASADGVNTLSEISEPGEVNQLLALCRRSSPGAISESFRQVLEQLARGKELAG